MPPESPAPNLQTIRAPEKVPAEADPETTEQLDHATQSHQLDRSGMRSELRSYNQDTDERKLFARRIFYLTCGWLTIVMLVVLADGFGTAGLIPFRLSDPVVLGLIGSTTLNIVGVFYVVVNYLFQKR
jgi:hypothetical protein